jgi:hypothetical protein
MARLFVPVAAFVAGLMLAACSNGGGAPSSDAPASGAGRSVTPAATSTSAPSTVPVEPTAQPPVLGGTPRFTKLAAPPVVGTGINGMTVVDGCPVMRDPPCPDKPVPASLSVLESSTGAVITTVDSDASGHFSIAVKPGQYLLRLANTAGTLPRQANPAKVTVESGHYTTVTVRLDSGMR